jgi:3-dehydroquinate synthetase/5-enolpyruvylshikimate-3-phosphate synthase
MTQLNTSAANFSPIRVAKLDQIEWPEHAVVIADAALPPEILVLLPDPITVEAGEGLKSMASVERLAEEVLKRRDSRPLVIVGVGGGSLGDAVGFLASILWRGVDLWHVPTTLVAMVDSAHGGKTAVNAGANKNQLGTFYPASRVILCEELLETLPVTQRRQGLVELIKGLWLGSPAGVDLLDKFGVERLGSAPYPLIKEDLWRVVDLAIAVKLKIVSQDPHEKLGIRTVLNLGHTLAHALELHCGLDHGSAVAWGMAAAGHLSTQHTGLSEPNFERLYRHVYPAMRHIHEFERPSVGQLRAALSRDKKRIDGQLRSVLLSDVGQPVVMPVSIEEWVKAFDVVFARWHDESVCLTQTDVWPAAPEVAASKSELNRMKVIEHLRHGSTQVSGRSRAADVVLLERGLEAMDRNEPVYVGDGGTTFRFLLALAALRPTTTQFQLSQRLYARPHQPLLDALNAGGCVVRRDDNACTIELCGWATAPKELEVDASASSQFASALALLAASGLNFALKITDSIASERYFEMTCSLLANAGVTITRTTDTCHFAPSAIAHPIHMQASPDESSNAVWRVLQWLGLPIKVPEGSSQQPDADLAQRIAVLTDPVDVTEMPDVFPVLCAGLALRGDTVKVVGGVHLRGKESNRIDDLVEELQKNGFAAVAEEDGIRLAGGQPAIKSLDPGHDHRLAFAALVLSTAGPLVLKNPWVVEKSYPEFYDDARLAGWSILPTSYEGA